MAEIGRWKGHRFEVSPTLIRSFNDLQIKVSSDTNTVQNNGQEYLTRKNWKPIEVSVTIHLCAGLGYDVQTEADAFVSTALTGGVTDYFYVGNRKLVTCQLMLTDATVSHIEIGAGGKWSKADVALTLKQAALLDGTATTPAPSTGSGGGYSAAAGSQKQTVTPTKTTTAKTVASALPASTTAAVSSAASAIKTITTAAKTASIASKVTTVAKAAATAVSVASKITSIFKKK